MRRLGVGLLVCLYAGVVNAGNTAANLDQCRNGAASAPAPCLGAAWVNGNAGASNAHYNEGDSISYRMVMTGLSLGSHTLIIQWDTTKSSKHAIDYITTWNRTADPASDACSDVLSANWCASQNVTAIPIGQDAAVPSILSYPYALPNSTQLQNFYMYAGAIDQVTFGAFGGWTGDTSQQVTINFTAQNSTVVLAWGGHIAKRQEWGAPVITGVPPTYDGIGWTGTAANITGSPYHMRLISLDGSGGNQDRSLSAAAVVAPSSITITKNATTNDYSFPFTASPSPLSDFTLRVQAPSTTATTNFGNIQTFVAYNVAETVPVGWAINTAALGGGIDCALSNISLDYGTNIFTKTIASNGSSGSISIGLGEGDDATCAFYDVATTGTLTVIKHVVNNYGGTAAASDFTMAVTGSSPSPASFAGSESGTTVTLNAGSYSVSESGPSGYAQSLSADCSGTIAGGQTKTCTVTNSDIQPKLTVIKHVINDNGGTATASSFTMNVTGTNVSSATFAGSESGITITLKGGSYSVSETGPSGYSPSLSADCSGTIAVGQTKTCTVTNDDQSAHLKLVKVVSNTHGGTAVATSFTLSAAGPTPISGAGGADSDVNAGTYTLSETTLTGYAASAWSCAGGTQSGSSITLALGQSATCTVANSDIQPRLTVIKQVIGSTADPSTFSISVTGNNASPSSFSGSSLGTTVYLNAGSYSVSEPPSAIYSAGYSIDCTGKIAVGDSKTCTITNTYLPPNVTVSKTPRSDFINPGGTATFTITASNAGPGTAFGFSFTDDLNQLPQDLTWTVDNSACSTDANKILTCTISTLAAGASFTVNVSALVPANYLVPPPISQQQAAAVVNPFEIDGDLIASSSSSSDWGSMGTDCTVSGKGCKVDLPTGSSDDSFGTGTKEDTPIPSVVSGSIPNNKSDLTRFYIATENISGADFVYLAWERVQAPKGSTNMDFEMNQSRTPSSNGVTPNRTAGDLLISYDLASGGTVPVISYRKWVTQSVGGQTASQLCEASTAFPCWGKAQAINNAQNATVKAAVNTIQVTDPILPGPNTLTPFTFGEALINLEGSGILPLASSNTQCIAFGMAYLKSRSSSSFTAEVKDFIKPMNVDISNCPDKVLTNTVAGSTAKITITLVQ